MTSIQRIAAPALVALMSFGFATAAIAPLPAQARVDCSSNRNLMHVHRRLDGAIDQLNHDRHDYGGHRARAIGDLQAARNELLAAEQDAINVDHESAACFAARGPEGGSDRHWGMRGQRGSNGNLAVVRRSVDQLLQQLQNDQHDYAGHRVAAIGDMQRARAELAAGDAYARDHK